MISKPVSQLPSGVVSTSYLSSGGVPSNADYFHIPACLDDHILRVWMMLLVDFVDIATKGRMSGIIKGGRWRQYALTSLLGSTPGCWGNALYVGFVSKGSAVVLSWKGEI